MTELINRPEYLNQLIQHKDVDLVKIVTGIRRCGKSSLLDLFHQYLLENDVTESHIIHMNLESLRYRNMKDYLDFYDYVSKRMPSEAKTIFTFGGATSVDQYRRIENISWWKEEMPTSEEFNDAKENLLKCNNQVDYIITHTCDAITIRNYLIEFRGKVSEIFMDNEMLDYFEINVKYKHWYFGHFHFDGKINYNKTEVYNDFHELK